MQCGTSSGRFSDSPTMDDHLSRNEKPPLEAGVEFGCGMDGVLLLLSEEGEQDLRSRVRDRNGLHTQLLFDL